MAARPPEAGPDELHPDEMFVSAWKNPVERLVLPLAHPVTQHDGRRLELQDLLGRPLLVSFVYTRCNNPNKCPAVMKQMAALRACLQQRQLLEKVRLALITYDPQRDTLEDLQSYSQLYRLKLDDETLFLRPSVDPEHRLYRDLNVAASFNPSGVAIHGVQLLLIDKAGRLARTYQVLLWDNQQVATDVAKLLEE